MLVRDAMSTVVLVIGPAHTLRQAARLMSARHVGAAVVLDPDTSGLGILTERDILNAIGAGLDPDHETAQTHTTTDVAFATPKWTLTEAASAMVRGGFRHLVVLDSGHAELGPAGMVSVRDILRCWSSAPVPAPYQTAAG
jgi:CBS domain-containing protein